MGYPVRSGQPVAFRTCLLAGCIAPPAFDASTLSHLRISKTMRIVAVSVRGQTIAFLVSLNGFSNAFDRIRTIRKQGWGILPAMP
ncbi:invasion associated locus B family protein [Komagataeibacter oboediens]|uniref:invasion associated locus B family protein n=1 Tax=Komagataeibacter oboediens TaxID=65958 RepID=UPI001907F92F|nr:invasion associated locus B family protein [Komagataeibacter oboediens]